MKQLTAALLFLCTSSIFASQKFEGDHPYGRGRYRANISKFFCCGMRKKVEGDASNLLAGGRGAARRSAYNLGDFEAADRYYVQNEK